MKVKVCIYGEKTQGAPLNVLMDPIYQDVENFSEISPLINTALNAVSAYLPDQEILTMVDTMGISRYMDIVNLQTYLRNNANMVLLVTEVTSDEASLGTDGIMIEVVSPRVDVLPMSTTYYAEDGQYDVISIITEQVEKFAVGDPNIIPNSSIRTLINSIDNLKQNGMTIFPMYADQLEYELMNYGFQMYYIYLR